MKNRLSENIMTAAVEAVAWERVTMHLLVRLEFYGNFFDEDGLRFYAVDRCYHARALYQKKKESDRLYRLSLNVSNTGDDRALPVGSYFIYVCRQDEILAKCSAAPEILPDMEDFSRSFLHSNRENGYLVNFFVSAEKEELPFMLHVVHMKKEGMNQIRDRDIIFSILKSPFMLLKKNAGKIYWRTYYKLKRKKYRNHKKTVLFMTEQSDTLGGNLAAVKKQMEKMGLAKEYEIMTSARPASYIPQTFGSTRRLLKKLAKAQTVYLDDHVPLFDWLFPDRKTKIIQLWHAGAGFKSAGYSRRGHLGAPAPVSCHRQYRYGIAGSRQIGIFFAEVFGINEERILPTGMPRMDEYLDPAYRQQKEKELYELYPMCRGKKVILFAPTYRGKNRKDAFYPYDRIDFDRLYRFCGEEYVVLFKMHPWVHDGVPIRLEHEDRFLDVGQYPDINDLFYFTEILITDYSSNIFEYSLMRKPMLFFAFDKVSYSFSRGFHRDYEKSAPGKVCYDFDSLMTALETKDYEYEKVEKYITGHFDHIDSDASKRVLEWTLLSGPPKEIVKEIEMREAERKKMERLDFTSLSEI
ncbi:MAG: CDP-glycerol glycerophosphotransferase family protein [Lachnospiraceae bacterium]|nr:CDP-glycerol glycerophosphotransferase family protein [Lachnospiraceae bacterium]